jgi:hypothetical protein
VSTGIAVKVLSSKREILAMRQVVSRGRNLRQAGIELCVPDSTIRAGSRRRRRRFGS